MAGIFKAYDVRGTYPDQINEDMARKIGRVFSAVLDENDLAESNTIVVGRDMREHSIPIQKALIEGLRASGLDVLDIGLATTPMNYFAVGSLKTAGGIQVTASHNPAQYNGLKFSKRDAQPVSGDDGIPLMERLVEAGEVPASKGEGSLSTAEVMDDYEKYMLKFLRRPEGAKKLKVAIDAANGMGTIYKPILEKLGIEVVPLYFELDGNFPNHEANPLKLENLNDLVELVKSSGADLGVCFDGDADRSAFVDNEGNAIGSDLITALIGGQLLKRDPGKHVLFDLRSSRAVAEYIAECGGIPVRERVGHSFMKATLRAKQGVFGGELAGHYYFRDAYHADSAILAVVEILNLLWDSGQTLNELVAPLLRYSKSPEINFVVEDKQGRIDALAERYADGKVDYLDGITVEYEDWWFNVRPSNTEPYLRLVMEAANPESLAAYRTALQAMLGDPV